MVSNVVKRFKEARLPAGSSWHEVTDKDGRRWTTSVSFKGGKWHRWPSLYTREADAKKEAEHWAQAVKAKGPQPLTGWKPV